MWFEDQCFTRKNINVNDAPAPASGNEASVNREQAARKQPLLCPLTPHLMHPWFLESLEEPQIDEGEGWGWIWEQKQSCRNWSCPLDTDARCRGDGGL